MGAVTLYIDVMCAFNTSIEPLDVEPSAPYMTCRCLLGVLRLGLISGSRTHLEFDGVSGLAGMCDGPAIRAECVVGESLKLVGGLLPIAVMIAHTGLSSRNEPLVDVRRLGFIAFLAMTAGLNGWTPVAAKTAQIMFSVNEQRNTHPNTPTKSPFVTLLICKFSKV